MLEHVSMATQVSKERGLNFSYNKQNALKMTILDKNCHLIFH